MSRWVLFVMLGALAGAILYGWTAIRGISIGSKTVTLSGGHVQVRSDPSAATLAAWELQARTIHAPTGTFLGFTLRESDGTAFFVNGGQLVTAAHVEAGAKNWGTVDSPVSTYRVDVQAVNPDYDIALLRPAERISSDVPVLTLRTDPPGNGEHVWALCAWPNRDAIPLTVVQNTKVRLFELQPNGTQRPLAGDGVALSGAAHPGCSGAPIVDTDGLVVGMLVTGGANQAGAVNAQTLASWLQGRGVAVAVR
jgi:S1-C subfamily serine protease